MNFRTMCVTCRAEEPKGPPELCVGEINNEGVVYATCPKGHFTATVFAAKRYEVLLRSAAKALIGGFSTESASSISAALERAYEFYVRVMCRAKQIDPRQAEAAWESVAAQSERQLGAFTYLHLLETGTHLMLDDKQLTRFRNKVIHRGYVAREAEVMEFGEAAYSRIRSIESAMARYGAAVKEELESQVKAQIATIPDGTAHCTLTAFQKRQSGGQIVGDIETFKQFVNAVRTSVERGFG